MSERENKGENRYEGRRERIKYNCLINFNEKVAEKTTPSVCIIDCKHIVEYSSGQIDSGVDDFIRDRKKRKHCEQQQTLQKRRSEITKSGMGETEAERDGKNVIFNSYIQKNDTNLTRYI